MSGEDTGEERMPRGSVAALGAMAFMVFVVANDVTSIAVALPRIQFDFDSDVSTVQWCLTGYAVAFGVLVITGGRLADMFGRRRVLLLGALAFAASSLLGGLAPSLVVLLFARAVMGVAAAVIWAATLGLVYGIVPARRAGLAGAIVIGTAGIGNAAGPLVGGLITHTFGWRGILLVNVPATAVAALVVARTVRADTGTGGRRLDALGMALLSGSLLTALVGLSVLPDSRWSVLSLVLLALLAVGLGAAFVAREAQRGEGALVPRTVMANPRFRAACVATVLMSSTWFTILLFLPAYFQQVADRSVLDTGVALVPLMLTYAVASYAVAPLARVMTMKAIAVLGAVLIGCGVLLLAFEVSAQFVPGSLASGMVVLGIGIGLFYSAVVTVAVTELPPDQSSLAGAVLYTFQVAGGAVGLGLTTLVFELAANTVSLDGGAAGVASAEIGSDAPVVFDAPFAVGLRWALVFNAVLAFAGVAVTVRRVGGPARALSRRAGRDVAAIPSEP